MIQRVGHNVSKCLISAVPVRPQKFPLASSANQKLVAIRAIALCVEVHEAPNFQRVRSRPFSLRSCKSPKPTPPVQ